MTIKENIAEIKDELDQFPDWLDKYNYIIELGKTAPLIDEKDKNDNNLITGCQSRVWLSAKYENEKLFFAIDSDAVITKGIAALLIRIFSEQSPQSIIDADLSQIDELGLKEHLSPTRSNGLTSMIKHIKMYALAYKIKSQK